MKKLLITAISLFLFLGCQKSESSNDTLKKGTIDTNPAAQGFNMKGSDTKAIAIADSVMKAMGGRQSWDQTKIISWNFFGNRVHTWDKMKGRDRIEIPAKNLVIDMNLNSKEGTVMKNGEEITQPDSLQKYLQNGYEMWVNDAYWLLMPYKLKDSGATLMYDGIDSTQTGIPAHKLKLTFDSVGVTPDNMYYVYVDTTDYMIRQWAYYPTEDMDEPQFVLPWKDYKQYGNIMLSGNRGKFTLSDIKVMDHWPDSTQ